MRAPKAKKKKRTAADEFLKRDRDPRPHWKRVDAASGLPLWEAMLFYGNQQDAKVVHDLTFQGYANEPYMPLDEMPDEEAKDYRFNRWILEDRRQRMEAEFKRILERGDVVTATGYLRTTPLDVPATLIIPDRWRLLEPNFTNSTAAGLGGEIAGILVFKRRSPQREKLSPPAYSASKLKAWYVGWVRQNQSTGNKPSRDEDLKAAQNALGSIIPRSALRLLRKELAPEDWRRKGRRKSE
jgi:hypothetical protein